MYATQNTIAIAADTQGWIKFNLNQTGYYRVNYPQQQWDLLEQALISPNSGLSTETDRAGLVNDVFSLAQAAILPVTQAMNLSRFLVNEEAYAVWGAASQQLSTIGRMLEFSPTYGYWQTYLVHLLTKQYERVGWTVSSSHLTKLFQSLILSWSCNNEVKDCRDVAVSMFQQFMIDPVKNIVFPDFRGTVYYTGIEEGGEIEWDFLYQRYKTTTVSAEAIRCLAALARSRTPWLLARLLSYTLDPTQIRGQDALSVITYVSYNPVGRHLAWDFFQDNWDLLFAQFRFSARNLLETVTSRFNTEDQYNGVQQFIKSKSLDTGSAEQSSSRALEAVRINILWMKTNFIPLQQWLITETGS